MEICIVKLTKFLDTLSLPKGKGGLISKNAFPRIIYLNKSFFIDMTFSGKLKQKKISKVFIKNTLKPLITNTSEEFIKCRLDNEFYTIFRKFQY